MWGCFPVSLSECALNLSHGYKEKHTHTHTHTHLILLHSKARKLSCQPQTSPPSLLSLQHNLMPSHYRKLVTRKQQNIFLTTISCLWINVLKTLSEYIWKLKLKTFPLLLSFKQLLHYRCNFVCDMRASSFSGTCTLATSTWQWLWELYLNLWCSGLTRCLDVRALLLPGHFSSYFPFVCFHLLSFQVFCLSCNFSLKVSLKSVTVCA